MHMLGIYEVDGDILKKQISGDKNIYKELGIALAKKILENN